LAAKWVALPKQRLSWEKDVGGLKGYANQPAPGGEDPDDPRAGQNDRPVRGRATFGEHQSNAMNSRVAGQNFSPAVDDPGDPTGPDGPEY